jgi:hypothetical protein
MTDNVISASMFELMKLFSFIDLDSNSPFFPIILNSLSSVKLTSQSQLSFKNDIPGFTCYILLSHYEAILLFKLTCSIYPDFQQKANTFDMDLKKDNIFKPFSWKPTPHFSNSPSTSNFFFTLERQKSNVQFSPHFNAMHKVSEKMLIDLPQLISSPPTLEIKKMVEVRNYPTIYQQIVQENYIKLNEYQINVEKSFTFIHSSSILQEILIQMEIQKEYLIKEISFSFFQNFFIWFKAKRLNINPILLSCFLIFKVGPWLNQFYRKIYH